MGQTTRIPNAPNYVKGVINLRGEIVPVIDLKKRFDLPLAQTTDDTRIIIVTVEDMTVGMVVDSATEVIHLSQNSIEKALSIAGSVDAQYVEGVGKLDGRLLIILNLAKVLKPSELTQLEQI